MIRSGSIFPLLLTVLGCSHLTAANMESGAPTVERLLSPAPDNSHLSRITSDEAGRVYLSWVTEEGAVARLMYSQLINDKWSEPATISQGSDWFINWADFPVLSVHAGNRVAHWPRRSGGDTYDYDVVARFYNGESQRWSEDTRVNTSGIEAEHGFVSMLPTGDESTLITWLDGRNTKQQPERGAMTLRAAEFDASGNNLREWELDRGVCDCCQTSSAMTAQGPVVVYRDRTVDEVRDTYIVRFTDDGWTEPQPVYRDGWQVAGCPVNGPAVAARNEAVAVAWFTAKGGSPTVQLAISSDSGETFSSPKPVAGPDTNGRLDAVILDNGEIVVSWIALADNGAKVMLSRFSADGAFVETVDMAGINPSRRSGFPVIDSIDNAVYLSWTDTAGPRRVRVARVTFE